MTGSQLETKQAVLHSLCHTMPEDDSVCCQLLALSNDAKECHTASGHASGKSLVKTALHQTRNDVVYR